MSEGEALRWDGHKSLQWDPKIKEELDKSFMEGFKAAYDLIDNIFCGYKEPPFDELWDEIEEEFENYKRDE